MGTNWKRGWGPWILTLTACAFLAFLLVLVPVLLLSVPVCPNVRTVRVVLVAEASDCWAISLFASLPPVPVCDRS